MRTDDFVCYWFIFRAVYVYVTYNGVKYTYQIKNIYLQVKTGQIGIYRDVNKTTLTLVTCTKNDEAHQTIYIAELINKN